MVVIERPAMLATGAEHERSGATYRFRVTRGEHRVAAHVMRGDVTLARLDDVAFTVK